MGKFFFYFMIFVYAVAGVLHLVIAEKYLWLMPPWLPYPLFLIYMSGVVEIALAILLLSEKTRKISSWLIIAMLVVYFFVIHGVQSLNYCESDNKKFILSVIRLLFQFVLIRWAWLYTRPIKSKISFIN